MSVAKDLAGKKFGRLTAIKYVFQKTKIDTGYANVFAVMKKSQEPLI